MPSVSSLSLLDFVNLGPLTSTFTAPAACATDAGRIGLARPSNPGFPSLFEDCELPTWGDCIPSGPKIDEDFAARQGNPERNDAVYYHKPASICPESWTTAGIAAKDSDGKLSTSGIYAPSGITTAPKSNPTPNIFMEALDAGETAILCCPSGYTANEGVGCHSTVPLSSYTADEVCQRSTAFGRSFVSVTFTYAGEPVTGIAVDKFGPTPDVVTRTTAPPRKGTAWVAATYVPAVTLVHGGGDGPKVTETSTTAKPEETKTSKDQPKPTSTKPAEDDEDKGDDKGDENGDKGGDKEVSSSSSASKKAETKTSEQPKPTLTPSHTPTHNTTLTSSATPKSKSSAGLTPSKGFTTSKAPASGVVVPSPTPTPGGQPGNNGGNGGEGSGNGSDGSGSGSGSNGSGSGSGSGDGAANEGEDPPNAGSARWGSLTATVTTVWGLAAVSGMLLAAL